MSLKSGFPRSTREAASQSSLQRDRDGSAASNGPSSLPTMTSAANGATTVVKYEKSSCLFCNEWFDSQTFTEHLIHCGQVLEECPNLCHVFVPRIRMRTHLKECPRAKQQQQLQQPQEQLPPEPKLNSYPGSNGATSCGQLAATNGDSRLLLLEQELTTLRSVLNEEIRQRLHLITDVGNLRKQNQIADDWTQGTEDALNALRKQLTEENVQRCYELDQCQNDFRYCYDALQSLKAELQNKIDALEKHIDQVSLQMIGHENQLNDNILKLEETVLLHEKINGDKFGEMEDFLNSLNDDLKTKFVANADLNAKQLTLDYEVKGMKNIVCETEERCDKLETVVSDVDKQLHQFMQTVADLENHLATQQRLASVQNSRGHLLWRIKDYSKKLEEAKQYDTILHSAMFSNKPYGYALRLDIHLNGRGTWKGRNILACLNVIAGEFDPLLSWPCRLQADIIIRDQSGDGSNAQDYVKTIVVRKKSDDYFQTNQYFHIPHKAITSGNYLKNDCLFVEVRVLK